jgi:hypothetical protein
MQRKYQWETFNDRISLCFQCFRAYFVISSTGLSHFPGPFSLLRSHELSHSGMRDFHASSFTWQLKTQNISTRFDFQSYSRLDWIESKQQASWSEIMPRAHNPSDSFND